MIQLESFWSSHSNRVTYNNRNKKGSSFFLCYIAFSPTHSSPHPYSCFRLSCSHQSSLTHFLRSITLRERERERERQSGRDRTSPRKQERQIRSSGSNEICRGSCFYTDLPYFFHPAFFSDPHIIFFCSFSLLTFTIRLVTSTRKKRNKLGMKCYKISKSLPNAE